MLVEKVVETNTWLTQCNQVYSKRHIADTYGAHEVVDPLNLKRGYHISNELKGIAFFLRSLWSRTIAIRNVSKTIVRMRQIKMNMSSFVSFVSTKSSQGCWQSEVFNILSLVVVVDQRVSVADRPRAGDFSSSIMTKQSLAVPHSSDISPLTHTCDPKKIAVHEAQLSRCTSQKLVCTLQV